MPSLKRFKNIFCSIAQKETCNKYYVGGDSNKLYVAAGNIYAEVVQNKTNIFFT